MIFKEAMNNCLKYSSAKKVMLEASLPEDDRLELRLIDNGKGFDMEHINRGHGLDNMHIRAQRINGRLSIKSELGKGTQIILNFRLLRDLPLKRG
jgi:signal transduction histidine kinase